MAIIISSTDQMKPLLVSLFMAEAANSAVSVWGDGGHSVGGSPLSISTAQTELQNQLVENQVDESDIFEDEDGNVRITGRLHPDQLVGETISEFGIKIGGMLIGIRNSSPLTKESDEELLNNITFIF